MYTGNQPTHPPKKQNMHFSWEFYPMPAHVDVSNGLMSRVILKMRTVLYKYRVNQIKLVQLTSV